MVDLKDIGARIRQRRKNLSLTQTKINELTGISSGNLSDIENGNRIPSAKAIILLSEVLNCSTDWILKGDLSKCEFISVCENSSERKLLEYFREMLSYDQDELLMIAKIKYHRAKEQKKSFPSQDEQKA